MSDQKEITEEQLLFLGVLNPHSNTNSDSHHLVPLEAGSAYLGCALAISGFTCSSCHAPGTVCIS